LTAIVKFVFAWLAVKLPVGESVSQSLVVQLCSDTWAVALVLLWAVTVSVCEAGVAPPAAAVNVKLEALNVSGSDVVAADTVRVTSNISEPWLDATVTVLVYVPTARPAGVTEIVRVAGVVLLLREAATQLSPLVDTVMEIGDVPPVIEYCCAAGAEPPI
jgi:hypothetical protein